MKLNKQGKDELRAKVVEQLANIPDGQRIHLDKEILEELLFDTYEEQCRYFNGKKLVGQKVKVKYLVWTGEFLKKIDLSEVSFDNVLWNLDYFLSYLFVDQTSNRYEGINEINLSNTNARIDFYQSFEGKYFEDSFDRKISINRCNFTNVDLSNNTLGNVCSCFLSGSDFSNTGITIDLDGKYDFYMSNCNFTGLDFSQYTVDESFFSDRSFDKDRRRIRGINCDFSNTGLHVEISKSNDYSSYHGRIVGQEIEKGHLLGCHVNGKEILSLEEYQAIAQQERDRYEQFKEAAISSVLGSIEEQKRHI